jgi:hypothetical protein
MTALFPGKTPPVYLGKSVTTTTLFCVHDQLSLFCVVGLFCVSSAPFHRTIIAASSSPQQADL